MDMLKEAIRRKRMDLTDNPEAVVGDDIQSYIEGLSPEEMKQLEEYLSEESANEMIDSEYNAKSPDTEMEDKEEIESYGKSPSVDDKKGDVEVEIKMSEDDSMEGEGDESEMEDAAAMSLYDERSLNRPGLRAKVSEMIKKAKNL